MYRHSEGNKSKSFKTCLLTFRCAVQHLQSIDLQRRLTNRKLGDLTGSDMHTEEKSIRIE